MTRGKNGISAAARKAVGERDQSIAAYQHNIRKLTAENAALRTQLDEQQKAHSKTVRVLKVERDEGLSPTLTVLKRQNEELTERARLVEHAMWGLREEMTKTWKRLFGHFESAHGLATLEAMEEAKRLLGYDSEWIPGDYNAATKVGPKAVRAIQRARGDRT